MLFKSLLLPRLVRLPSQYWLIRGTSFVTHGQYALHNLICTCMSMVACRCSVTGAPGQAHTSEQGI
jgi:hypothetical protein